MTTDEIEIKLEILADLRQAIADTVTRKEAEKAAALPDEVLQKLEEIESAYAPGLEDLASQVAELEAKIKPATVAAGHTIHGSRLMCVFFAPPVKWNSEKLAGMMELIPQLAGARTVGEPSAQIRTRK